MARCVILLRGVNVGKAKRLPMAEFRELLESLGCTRVRTLLNSGNGVADCGGIPAAALAERVSRGITERFGFQVPVVVVTASALEAIVAGNALARGVDDPSRLLVAFCGTQQALAGLAGIEPLLKAGERFLLTAHAAYLHCPEGLLESRAGEALLTRRDPALTTRNGATVLKLLALVRDA